MDPSKNFKFQFRIDEVWVSQENIILAVEPSTTNHQQYQLPDDVQSDITQQIGYG